MTETLSNVLEHKGRKVLTTQADTKVVDVAETMGELHVGALLVVQGERPIGIVSERDVLKKVVAAKRDPATTSVRDIMTSDVICVEITATPKQAMAIMTERRVRHLPVVAEGKLVGMISIGDLTRWVSLNQQHEIALLNDYILGRYPG